MIDFVQGQYILVKSVNFIQYLGVLGCNVPTRNLIITWPVTVEIMNPSNQESPFPGFWFFSETYGGINNNFKIDTAQDYDLTEKIGCEILTRNKFEWQGEYCLIQQKKCEAYALTIKRNFLELGFVMEISELNANPMTTFYFQRV